MAKKKPDLVRRQEAIDKTMKRFRGKAFKLGEFDCVQLIRYHLRQMGHRHLPVARGYSEAVGARKVLRESVKKVTGKAPKQPTLVQLMDGLLERIPPAAMLAGDIAIIPEDPDGGVGLGGTLVVSVGRKWIGWHPDAEGMVVIEPVMESPFIAAWRA